MQRKTKVSVSRSARRACVTHPQALFGVLAVHVLVRLLPVAVLMLWPQMAHGAWPAFPWAVSLLWWVFAVIPERFWAGERLRYYSSPKQYRPQGGKPYVNWLKAGFARYGRGCLWGLPFLVCVGYFLYGWDHLPFNDMWMPVMQLGRLFDKEPNFAAGLPVAAVLMVLFIALLLYGWWRDLPAEYVPVRHMSVRRFLRTIRQTRRRGKKKIVRTTIGNIVLSLPGFLGAVLVLGGYIAGKVNFSSSPEIIVASLMRLTRQPLPGETRMQLLLVFLILYLPLALFRKMRNAVRVRRLTQDCDRLGNDHAAG